MATDIKYIRDQPIRLDGKTLDGAKVVNCEMRYGGGIVRFKDTVFDGGRFIFDKEARNTLAFLGAIYAQGGADLVDSIFDGVRRGDFAFDGE